MKSSCILISGPIGSGKTLLAETLAKTRFKNKRVVIWDGPEEAYREMLKPRTFVPVCGEGLIVLLCVLPEDLGHPAVQVLTQRRPVWAISLEGEPSMIVREVA